MDKMKTHTDRPPTISIDSSLMAGFVRIVHGISVCKNQSSTQVVAFESGSLDEMSSLKNVIRQGMPEQPMYRLAHVDFENSLFVVSVYLGEFDVTTVDLQFHNVSDILQDMSHPHRLYLLYALSYQGQHL